VERGEAEEAEAPSCNARGGMETFPESAGGTGVIGYPGFGQKSETGWDRKRQDTQANLQRSASSRADLSSSRENESYEMKDFR